MLPLFKLFSSSLPVINITNRVCVGLCIDRSAQLRTQTTLLGTAEKRGSLLEGASCKGRSKTRMKGGCKLIEGCSRLLLMFGYGDSLEMEACARTVHFVLLNNIIRLPLSLLLVACPARSAFLSFFLCPL